MSTVPTHAHKRRRKARRRWPRALFVTLIVIALIIGAAIVIQKYRNNAVMTTAAEDTTQSTPLGVEVSGRVGAIPVVNITQTLNVTDVKRHVDTVGDGREITEGSPVLVSVTAFDGSSGAILSPDGRPQLTVGTASAEGLGPELAEAVIGHTEGSRIIYVRPVSQEARAEGATSNIEIDVVDILYSVARGTAVDVSTGPLDVTLGAEGPVIRHGDEAPTQTTVQTLLRGDGQQVKADDRIVMQFIVTGWSDQIERDSTWRTGIPMVLRLDQAMPGLRQAVVDQRVGSRLAITIPADQATGDDILCVVVDLLGTEPAPEQTADEAATSTDTSQAPAQ
ncbi:FKBP-type peptidyl-prolyl cis-trans isomerase [Schaalia suimastitidis]|uniref:FKBP-type peptidyl-prolyl cis-trans isomerase n=1 Tax=Schaalia suimastitidis TaxID=121163 RepID=UPI00042A1B86|nr:FKBP-type peptidyl-prolyl cis-trans isomerase [Schaalia suimastitidis]